MKLLEKLTDYQRNFAEENHSLVLSYLSKRRLPYEEFYCVVIPGYLRAVVNYDRRDDLKKYKFSTIAFRHMDSDWKNYIRYRVRRKNILHTYTLDSESNFIESKINIDFNTGLLLKEVQGNITSEQQKIIDFLLEGYTLKEISQAMNISFEKLTEILYQAQEELRKILI